MKDLLEKIAEWFDKDILNEISTWTTTKSSLNIWVLTEKDILEVNKKMREFWNKPKMFPELRVVNWVIRKKKRADHFFKKHLNKLWFSKCLDETIDTLIICENAWYKKWSPKNKFRWANPKYQVMWFNSELIRMKPTRPMYGF